jgi:hypothetical protein
LGNLPDRRTTAMYDKPMTPSEQLPDDSYAKVLGNTVEIFGQSFPLTCPQYYKTDYKTGALKSFDIKPTVIKYMGREIPIGGRITLYEDGKFHGATIKKGYKYEHRGQLFKIIGGIFFYKNGNLEKIIVDCDSNKKIETAFVVDGQKLLLNKWDRLEFYEQSGALKTIRMNYSRAYYPPLLTDLSQDYNVLEVSETGEITAKIMESRPNFDPD